MEISSSKGRLKIVAVDDILFRKSMEIGPLLLLSNQVLLCLPRSSPDELYILTLSLFACTVNASAYDAKSAAAWMRANRVHFVPLAVVCYIPQVLSNRRKSELREVCSCVIGSICKAMCHYCLAYTELLEVISVSHLWKCMPHTRTLSTRLSGHAMFTLHIGKSCELFYTVLLVLRGRPVLRLHVFHHCYWRHSPITTLVQ
uniref:Very-long-chain 3-oxoacyl-CoA synthase n=1 Tax=Ascaris lumbricoides TaxID=6252 RepID=A0A0M3IG89_ASCLU